jgi:polysaccharide biosynthesis transport protein
VPEPLDAFRYIRYIQSRWRLVAASCGIAVALTLAVSLAMTPQYTSTAHLLIDPPAGGDSRITVAVSPVYLESLKTYEHFAASDSLFQKALDELGLRRRLGSGPIESLKKKILKVAMVRNTRILEIAVTLPDARMAQALARRIAESAVALNHDMLSQASREILDGLEQQVVEARKRLAESDVAWQRLAASEPIEDLRAAMESGARLREDLEQQAVGTELEISGAVDRARQATGGDLAEIRRQESEARARLDEIHKRVASLERQAAEHENLLGVRTANRDKQDVERKARQAGLAAIENRLEQARGEAGYRGERLSIVDGGIVPERPSSPNLPLDLAAALLAGLVLPVIYLTLEMSYREEAATEVATSRRMSFRE